MKKKLLISAAVLFCGAIILFNVVQAVGSTPGSDGDPLITSSYLEKKLQEISTALTQKIDQTNESMVLLDKKIENINKVPTQGSTTEGGFQAITLEAGKKLVCGASTQIILRSGSAKAISQNSSGLSDVTVGSDIKAGAYISRDHLLIVPRADGRGILAATKCVVMVSGSYQIQ